MIIELDPISPVFAKKIKHLTDSGYIPFAILFGHKDSDSIAMVDLFGKVDWEHGERKKIDNAKQTKDTQEQADKV